MESNGKCGRYVTLSHRWPPNLSLKTTSQSIDQHRQGIPLSRMPATFRDAVIVCRKLGIRYLWIDALCILQGSDEDWAKEAPQMGPIYSNAVFTISALDASSSDGGLFRDRPPVTSVTFESPVPEESKSQVMGLRVSMPSFDSDMERSPLDARGWVYQERLLSNANLHYGPNQMLWECQTVVSPECSKPNFFVMNALTYEFGRWLWLAKTRSTDPMGEWQEMVAVFSRKQFTVKTDKLAAIMAIASRLTGSDLLNSKFVAGVWLEDLHKQLLWTHDPRLVTRSLGPPPAPREDLVEDSWRPRSPSWSWISVDYPTSAMFNSTLGTEVDPDINFTVIDVSPSSDVDISAYRHDRANIELLLQGIITPIPAGPLAGPPRRTVYERTIAIPDMQGMPLSVSIDPGRMVPDILFCLKLATFSGHGVIPEPPCAWFLVLELVPRTNNDGLLFRRMGVGTGSKDYVNEFFRDGKRYEFKLI